MHVEEILGLQPPSRVRFKTWGDDSQHWATVLDRENTAQRAGLEYGDRLPVKSDNGWDGGWIWIEPDQITEIRTVYRVICPECDQTFLLPFDSDEYLCQECRV